MCEQMRAEFLYFLGDFLGAGFMTFKDCYRNPKRCTNPEFKKKHTHTQRNWTHVRDNSTHQADWTQVKISGFFFINR